MTMKEHILAALREQLNSWEALLSSLSEELIISPHFDFDWSIKDVVAHLWAWQQISIARIAGGLQDREPEFPGWIAESIPDWEEEADRVNALTFEQNHNKPWSDISSRWREGFSQLLATSEKISERNLLDGDRYSWLNGHSLAFILVASYDHHQEHYEKLIRWLQEREKT